MGHQGPPGLASQADSAAEAAVPRLWPMGGLPRLAVWTRRLGGLLCNGRCPVRHDKAARGQCRSVAELAQRAAPLHSARSPPVAAGSCPGLGVYEGQGRRNPPSTPVADEWQTPNTFKEPCQQLHWKMAPSRRPPRRRKTGGFGTSPRLKVVSDVSPENWLPKGDAACSSRVSRRS